MTTQSMNDDVDVWIPEDGGSIHMRVVTPAGDPVELSSEEARDLAAKLLELAARLD